MYIYICKCICLCLCALPPCGCGEGVWGWGVSSKVWLGGSWSRDMGSYIRIMCVTQSYYLCRRHVVVDVDGDDDVTDFLMMFMMLLWWCVVVCAGCGAMALRHWSFVVSLPFAGHQNNSKERGLKHESACDWTWQTWSVDDSFGGYWRTSVLILLENIMFSNEVRKSLSKRQTKVLDNFPTGSYLTLRNTWTKLF